MFCNKQFMAFLEHQMSRDKPTPLFALEFRTFILGFMWLWVGFPWKVFTREYQVNAAVPQGSIPGPTLFLLYINDLPHNVISNIVIYSDDTTLFWMWLGIWSVAITRIVSKLESNLRVAVEWGRKWLVDFNAEKTQLVSFDWSDNTSVIWGAPNCHLELLHKVQKQICRTADPSHAASCEALAHHWNVFPLLYSWGRYTCYSDRLHDFSVTIPRCYKDVYVDSFFPCTASLWNSLPKECSKDWPMILVP